MHRAESDDHHRQGYPQQLLRFESRAEQARTRAHELRERRAELALGLPATTQSVARARRRAQQALERARSAHEASAQRHLDASARIYGRLPLTGRRRFWPGTARAKRIKMLQNAIVTKRNGMTMRRSMSA